jgi:hypothetical protein
MAGCKWPPHDTTPEEVPEHIRPGRPRPAPGDRGQRARAEPPKPVGGMRREAGVVGRRQASPRYPISLVSPYFSIFL